MPVARTNEEKMTTYRIVVEYRVKSRKSALAKHALLNRISGLEFLSICYGEKHDNAWKKKIRDEQT